MECRCLPFSVGGQHPVQALDEGPHLAATPVLHVGVACKLAALKTHQASRCHGASSFAHLADGHRVMQAMGMKMTRLTNSRGEQLSCMLATPLLLFVVCYAGAAHTVAVHCCPMAA